MAFGRKIRQCTWVCLALAMGPFWAGCAFHNEAAPITSSWQPPPETVVNPQGLPQISKWMLNKQYEPAHWLGELYRGRNLREPINIVIADVVAQSAEEAREHLLQNFKAAGYLVRKGHSTGYHGYIDGVIYEQFPDGEKRPFRMSHLKRITITGGCLGRITTGVCGSLSEPSAGRAWTRSAK
jgi:hypothetical protein